ncbi:hypothetical protein [Streptomyces sp. LBL]|uniref:hypothetical protein n=1 Tax=Streptomyces sp. LBL TaxID=2940562 RepID=UPI0024739C1F|nr:hypothetical protein [Streptomyces sp. LBL]
MSLSTANGRAVPGERSPDKKSWGGFTSPPGLPGWGLPVIASQLVGDRFPPGLPWKRTSTPRGDGKGAGDVGGEAAAGAVTPGR